VTDDASQNYPGEFEVLRTKAEAGFWDQGQLRLTNYRLTWTPSRFAKTPAFTIELDKIASTRIIRSLKYLLMAPGLRLTLRDGTIYEIYNPKEDMRRLQQLVDDYRSRERYQPGSLFGGGS
jgi:hypothetical protein